MAAHTSFDARDRWRLRQNRLWILAALLGAATIYSFGGIIHDNTQRHIAGGLVRKGTAERIAAFASARATVLALETFAPVATPKAGVTARAALDDLVRRQAVAAACRCRDTLPAKAFFRLDLANGRLEIAPASATATLPASALLAEIARGDAARREPGPPIHVTAGRSLRDAATITYVQYDDSASPRAVYGLVAPVREVGTVLFADADRSTTVVELGARMALLDSVSLMVIGPDSTAVFGALERSGRFFGVTYPRGPLDGFAVSLALAPWQMHRSLLTIIPQRQLWHNGMLMLSTILVIVFAVGSARRENLLSRARADFVAGVSHDLRMPLAQILLASETLVKHPDGGERERLGLANAIVRETRRLIGLVENLLLFSRGGSVDLRPRLEPVGVDELFAGAVEAVELSADDARQSIDAQPARSFAVLGDKRLLRQALVNLIDNALKYGKPGQSIELRAEPAAGGAVRLCVDDEGPGIPASERNRVFEPYERLGRDQTSERTGTGLGLSVVRQIVRGCGGRVWLESSPRGGTRAVLELKAARV